MAGGLSAGPAFAYPPGTSLAVSATAVGQPNSHKHQQFAVQITNGKPGCSVQISGGEKPVSARIGSDGTASATVESEYHKGTVTITAKTVHCQGAKEKASTQISLSPGEVHGAPSVKRGQRIEFTLERWLPHRRIYVVATNGKTTQKFTGWPDSNGKVKVHFTPNKKGTWAVIVMQDGVSASVTIKVT